MPSLFSREISHSAHWLARDKEGGGKKRSRDRLSPGGLLVQMGCSPGEEYDIAGLGRRREKAVAKKVRHLPGGEKKERKTS